MIASRAQGGFFDTQVFAGILALFITVSAVMGIIDIKRKQIDQHRKWMMRAWVHAASIIALRFVLLAAVQVIRRLRGFYVQLPCEQLKFLEGNVTMYPQCTTGGARTAVEANLFTKVRPEEAAAAFQLPFGMAGVIAFTIHALLIEVYFHLTAAESERLRNVSYDRQLQCGYKHPGSGGLTSDRLGDTPRWKPTTTVSK